MPYVCISVVVDHGQVQYKTTKLDQHHLKLVCMLS